MPVVYGARVCTRNKLQASESLANSHLHRVAANSRPKRDNEVRPVVMHRSFSIYLTAEENLAKSSVKKPSDEGYANSHRLKRGT